jgi:DNA polymerase bacteriophage-type
MARRRCLTPLPFPPSASCALMYEQYSVGCGVTTVLPDMDFETYSEAGFIWTGTRWVSSAGKGKQGGIGVVGAWAYSEHPSTEVICLWYDLKEGRGRRCWKPGDAPPEDLFAHLRDGLIEAHNSFFEYAIWTNVCVTKYGWPPLVLEQTRDSAAKCGAFSLPRKLETAAQVMGTVAKDKAGHAVMLKLSKPRTPTKNNPSRRWTPENAPADFAKLYAYGEQDIVAEADLSLHLPDLSPYELELWKLDQRINARGIQIDVELATAAALLINKATLKYTLELVGLTNGAVKAGTEVEAIRGWLAGAGYLVDDMAGETLEARLKDPNLPPSVRRVIELRLMLGSAAVKKVDAMLNRASRDGRIRDMFMYCGAARTGRWGGAGVQPHNMPKDGPKVGRCSTCNGVSPLGAQCLHCGAAGGAPTDWGVDGVEAIIPYILHGDIELLERVWGNPFLAVSGCLRSMFVAAEGHDLICVDFSAIEAVVLAALAGEEWRLEVFRTHGKIYEASAAAITGTPFEEFIRHKEETGQHHPFRAKIGKVAELASGFGGGMGAWKRFGADDFMDDEEMQHNIYKWRAASPAVVDLWHGLEAAAHAAVDNPGQCFDYRGIQYGVKDDVLYCQLLSGRKLVYIRPRLRDGETPWGSPTRVLSFEGLKTFVVGQSGGGTWMLQDTWYGQLVENVVQATARDILAAAMLRLEAAGYRVVLHVHDEPVVEVPHGFGSVEEVERIVAEPPEWAPGWPIKVGGGWRGRRYRKE